MIDRLIHFGGQFIELVQKKVDYNYKNKHFGFDQLIHYQVS